MFRLRSSPVNKEQPDLVEYALVAALMILATVFKCHSLPDKPALQVGPTYQSQMDSCPVQGHLITNFYR
jgi:hypothetical protein